jgi:hypothetical protein
MSKLDENTEYLQVIMSNATLRGLPVPLACSAVPISMPHISLMPQSKLNIPGFHSFLKARFPDLFGRLSFRFSEVSFYQVALSSKAAESLAKTAY